MADTFTNFQTLTYGFGIVNGLGALTDLIDGAPVSLDSDPSVATSAIVKLADVGKYSLVVTGLTPSPDPATPQRTTVTIDADLTAGVSNITGFVEYTVTQDGRLAASGIQFDAPVAADKA